MKKIILTVMLITLILLTTTISYGSIKKVNIKGKTIILDAGHGGKDKGTSVGGIYESDINLEIVLKLREKFILEGANVILIRDGDYDLSSPNTNRRKKSDFDNRILLINNSNADLYISIHINYLDNDKYYGAQVFYAKDNKELAKVIQKELKKGLDSPMNEKKLSDSIYMYKKLTIPGVLIECGFLSNKRERNLLINDEYQTKLVNSIVQGVKNYY